VKKGNNRSRLQSVRLRQDYQPAGHCPHFPNERLTLRYLGLPKAILLQLADAPWGLSRSLNTLRDTSECILRDRTITMQSSSNVYHFL